MEAAAEIDELGWHTRAERTMSPNFDDRPVGIAVDLIVIHAISLPPEQFGGDGVEQLFLNRLDPCEHPYYREIEQLRVSAHFFIRRDGRLMQFVSCHHRAWHAGISRWKGRDRCNDFSIGIELEGHDSCAFDDAQYLILDPLLLCLRAAFPIVDVVGHSDIAPGRKTDPGPCFEWNRLTKR